MGNMARELMEAIMATNQDPVEEASARFVTAINGLGGRVNAAKQAAMGGDNATAFDELSGLVRDLQDVIQIGSREGGLTSSGYSKAISKAKDLRSAILGISNDLADLNQS